MRLRVCVRARGEHETEKACGVAHTHILSTLLMNHSGGPGRGGLKCALLHVCTVHAASCTSGNVLPALTRGERDVRRDLKEEEKLLLDTK